MQIIDGLNDMKKLNTKYHQLFLKQHSWAQFLTDAYNNPAFNNIWSAFYNH